jgi:hypothetical protein
MNALGGMSTSSDPLFVWESKTVYEPRAPDGHGFDRDMPSPYFYYERSCPYCGELMDRSRITLSRDDGDEYVWNAVGEEREFWRCSFCGYFEDRFIDDSQPLEDCFTWAVLRSFPINDANLALSVLGAYLHQRHDRLQDLSWRRFEELLAAMFREHGLQVVLGRGTKDHGIDLLLLEGSSGRQTLVQVKRWRGNVGVQAVRELRGVQLRENAPHAILVSSGGFTAGAHGEAKAPLPFGLGFRLDLMAATDVAKELRIFHAHDTDLVKTDHLRRNFRETR